MSLIVCRVSILIQWDRCKPLLKQPPSNSRFENNWNLVLMAFFLQIHTSINSTLQWYSYFLWLYSTTTFQLIFQSSIFFHYNIFLNFGCLTLLFSIWPHFLVKIATSVHICIVYKSAFIEIAIINFIPAASASSKFCRWGSVFLYQSCLVWGKDLLDRLADGAPWDCSQARWDRKKNNPVPVRGTDGCSHGHSQKANRWVE